MIKVAHLLTSNKYGGAERVAMDIIKGLKKDVSFIYLSPQGTISESLKQANIVADTFQLADIWSLIKSIRSFQPDIIHAHDFKASILANLLFPKISIVTHIHQAPAWQTKRNLRTLMFLHTARKNKKILYVSDWARESFLFHSKLRNTQVVHNGIDFLEIEKLSQQTGAAEYDLLFVGRLEPVKNPLRFVRIARSLSDILPTIKIGIVGDGSLYEVLAEECKQIPQVTLLGFRTNPYPLIANAKVVISTSNSDAFGLTMIEAAALKTIPFAPNLRGIADITTHIGGQVYLDEQDCVQQLVRLYTTDVESKRAHHSISKSSLQSFSLDNYLKEIRRVYHAANTM